jgi:GNAT superfamily N-acetyltransferase
LGVVFEAPRELRAGDDLDLFECGKPALDEWFKRYAKLAAGAGTAKTFVVCTSEGEVAGFYSLATGQVRRAEASGRLVRGVGGHDIPVIVLARLAVDLKYAGQGLGHGLLQDCAKRVVAVSNQVGVRALLTHAKDEDAAGFYARFGFEQSPLAARQMMILLKDLKVFFEG